MPTSTRFVVSVHMLALMARHGNRPLPSEVIAADVGTNPAVIRALLSRLSTADLTTSQRGKGGGALLARAPEDIRLLDIYAAVEEREIFTVHNSAVSNRQGVGGYVLASLVDPLRLAREAMERELAQVTVQDMVDRIALLIDRKDHAGGRSG